MSANDYYGQKPLPTFPQSSESSEYYGGGHQQQQQQQQQPYQQQGPSLYSTPSQSQSGYGGYGGGYGGGSTGDRPPQGKTSPSPFETVFDDHVYPASSHQTPAASRDHLSQQDTGYHSLARVSDEDLAHNHPADDIPLQNTKPSRNNSFKDPEMQDHVYDAPQQGQKKSKKRGVRFGELGMLGANSKRIPWVCYIFTVAQIGVFIGEVIKNAMLTGSPIMTQPSFNPMIGPSTYVLINMGARFVPCMHNTPGVQDLTSPMSWPCPNSTTLDVNSPMNHCNLSELCGFGGVPKPLYNGDINQSPEPNQWFRFIVPIFLHAGLIHIGFNMLLQMTMGRDMERAIGSIRFFLVYMSAGIFGFVMGGNFAASGIPSTGASGSLFGIIALTLLDLLYSWKDRRSPWKDLIFIALDVVISFVLGLLPGLDNFSHIGGFLIGLMLGISVLHSPNSLRRRIGEDTPYTTVTAGGRLTQGISPSFFKNPIGFFKGRKPLWWAWWLVRVGALVLVLVVFIVLLNNFYIYHHTCSWCKYLSCIKVNDWCEIGNLTITHADEANTTKRDLGVALFEKMAKLYKKV